MNKKRLLALSQKNKWLGETQNQKYLLCQNQQLLDTMISPFIYKTKHKTV